MWRTPLLARLHRQRPMANLSAVRQQGISGTLLSAYEAFRRICRAIYARRHAQHQESLAQQPTPQLVPWRLGAAKRRAPARRRKYRRGEFLHNELGLPDNGQDSCTAGQGRRAGGLSEEARRHQPAHLRDALSSQTEGVCQRLAARYGISAPRRRNTKRESRQSCQSDFTRHYLQPI